jgi:hypothetical protein
MLFISEKSMNKTYAGVAGKGTVYTRPSFVFSSRLIFGVGLA